MPVRLPNESQVIGIGGMNYEYDYPDGLKLKPGTPLHERTKQKCMELAWESRSVMMQRHSAWDQIMQTLTAYLPSDTKDALNTRLDPRKPTNVVIPISYANYEVTLTYLINSLLADPIFRYTAAEPGDKVKAMLLELLISNQMRKARNWMELYIMLQDALRYGFGVVHVYWERRLGKRILSRDVMRPSAVIPGEMYTEQAAGTVEQYVSFEGNVFEAIDPYLYFPDTSVPIYKPQDGDYVAWLTTWSQTKLQNFERQSSQRDTGLQIFNAKYVQHVTGRSTMITPTARTMKVGGIDVNVSGAVSARRPVDILWMYRNVIPSEEGLGDSDELEQWIFAIANDQIILAAQPTGLEHGRVPIAVIAPEADGHTIMPISRLELGYGMQNAVNFFFNSHFASVSKGLQDTLVIDPGLLNLETLKNSDIIRHLFIRRSHWGLGKIDSAVKQLNVYDVTQNHMRDIGGVSSIFDSILGSADELKGSVAKTNRERITANETEGARQGAYGRMAKIAIVMYNQGFIDLAELMGFHTRQLMTEETYVRVIGRHRMDLMREYGLTDQNDAVLIKPDMIDVDWDTLASDAQGLTGASVQSWLDLYAMALKNSQVIPTVSMTRMFLHIARLLGANDIHDFLLRPGEQPLQTQIVPDEVALEGAANGQLVPLNQMEGMQ